jgi:hypothetical protein
MDRLQATAEIHATITDLLTYIGVPPWLARLAFTDEFLDDVIVAYQAKRA